MFEKMQILAGLAIKFPNTPKNMFIFDKFQAKRIDSSTVLR